MKSLSRVWLFAISWDCSLPGSSVHGIFQARILEWVARPFSRGLPDPWIEPGFPALQVDSPGKPKNLEVDSLSLLQGIFPTQESNWGLLHCRQILYQLSYEGSPTANSSDGGLDTKSCPTLATPWTVACHIPLSMGFSRQEYWSGVPLPSTIIQKDICTPMFTAALFTIARTWKQPRCPSKDE